MENTIRILEVVTTMNRGGLETMLMNYYRHMDRARVQMDFLMHRSFEGDYDKEILSLGGRIFHLPKLNPFSISYEHKLKNFFLSHPEYKVIHVHQDCMSGVILRVAKKCGVEVRIAHSHSTNQDKDWKYIIKLAYKRMISKYATDLMACGEASGRWMFGTDNFIILNNAIDTSKYMYSSDVRDRMRKEFEIEDDEILIGHVGRFNYPKNHSFLIDIFYEFQKKKPCSKLILVGEGVLRKEIEEKTKLLKINQKVIFTGLRRDVNEIMQAMDVFVFPSIYEGFPVSIIEAQTAGLPCIISPNVPIECKKTNLVFQMHNNDDIDSWCRHILEALELEREDYSQEIIKSGFDIAYSAKWLENFYIQSYMKIS